MLLLGSEYLHLHFFKISNLLLASHYIGCNDGSRQHVAEMQSMWEPSLRTASHEHKAATAAAFERGREPSNRPPSTSKGWELAYNFAVFDISVVRLAYSVSWRSSCTKGFLQHWSALGDAHTGPHRCCAFQWLCEGSVQPWANVSTKGFVREYCWKLGYVATGIT